MSEREENKYESELTKLVKERMEKLVVEVGGSFDIKQSEIPPARPELTPPFVNELMKVKPIRESWERVMAEAQAKFGIDSDQPKDYKYTVCSHGYDICIKLQRPYSTSIEAKAKVNMCRYFVQSLQYSPFRVHHNGPSVGTRINLDHFLLKWLVPSKSAEIMHSAPTTVYKVQFNLPTLNEMYLASASERKVAEEFLNDWRVRDYFLKLKPMSFSIGTMDPFDDNRVIGANAHFDSSDPLQLKNLLGLMRISLELFTDWGIIEPLDHRKSG